MAVLYMHFSSRNHFPRCFLSVLAPDDVNNPGYGTIADASLEATSELLGVDPDSLRFALTNRQVQTGNRASIAVKQLGEKSKPQS